MTVWKNPCLLCGCGVSVYWPNCPCQCHKGDKSTLIQWNNAETPAQPPQSTPDVQKDENKKSVGE